VPFELCPAKIDEAKVKASLLAEKQGADAIANALAERKAAQVSNARPQAFVLGCDQTLAFEGRVIDKSTSLTEARALLRQLRGKPHQLHTACVLAKSGAAIWRRLECCTLWMRSFDDEFLDEYLQNEGGAALGSVGCYHLEGRGIQLFERVEGDYFSVLGLPLIPLLTVLRDRGVLGR
jgi:septum formation protein